MAPDIERSVTNASKSKMLTMDVIELTLLLKSIGFGLQSIDYDEFYNWKKTNDYGRSGASASATPPINAASTADADHHFIRVDIFCSKSKLKSHLLLKINDNEIAETDVMAASHVTTDSAKFMACTCPKRESRSNSNSFWEVQRSGTFAHQRRSVNGLLNGETGIDHETSSNLLPSLSTKSIALTNVLTQVLLNQYKNNSSFGESIVKDVDIKSIMLAVGKANTTSTIPDGKVNKLPSVSQGEDLNLITPLSSMNVTSNEQNALLNFTISKAMDNDGNGDELVGRNTIFNETVNTEAFSSPKSDLVTSSPHAVARPNERDAGIISHLDRARKSIDRALLSMKLNVTRNMSQELALSALANSPNVSVEKNQNRFTGVQATQAISGRNTSALGRAPISTLNRRASLGSISKMPSKNVGSPAITSRLNVTRSSSTERPVNAPSKYSLARRAMSGIGGRTAASMRTSTEQPTTIKRSTLNLRRTSSPAVISNATTSTNALITRKTIATTKLASLPSKVAKN